MSSDLVFYGELLIEIKDRIRQNQTRAALSANAEMIAMSGHRPHDPSTAEGKRLGGRRH